MNELYIEIKKKVVFDIGSGDKLIDFDQLLTLLNKYQTYIKARNLNISLYPIQTSCHPERRKTVLNIFTDVTYFDFSFSEMFFMTTGRSLVYCLNKIIYIFLAYFFYCLPGLLGTQLGHPDLDHSPAFPFLIFTLCILAPY